MRETLVKRATLGTNRTEKNGENAAPELVAPFDELNAALDAADDGFDADANRNAWRLLLAAGVETLADAAGWIPSTVAKPLDFCPPETTPQTTERGADVLLELLEECRRSFAPDVARALLRRAAKGARRLATARLPEALDFLAKNPKIRTERAAIATLLGEVGRRLARMNPDWAPLVSDAELDDAELDDADFDDAETTRRWEEGTPDERTATLKTTRTRNPNAAREMLESVWKTEKAELRERFLRAFGDRLADADVPFLERALSDRSANVRTVAANWLAKIPTSDLARRVGELGDEILSNASESTVPQAFNAYFSGVKIVDSKAAQAELKRIGANLQNPIGVAPSDWLFVQILGRVPLERWEAKFGETPEKIAARFAEDDSAFATFVGWTNSFRLFAGPKNWFSTLYSFWGTRIAKEIGRVALVDEPAFLEFAAERFPDKFRAAVRSVELSRDSARRIGATVGRLLAGTEPTPWSDEFASYFYASIRREDRSGARVVPYFPCFSTLQRTLLRQEFAPESPVFARCSNPERDKIARKLDLCDEFAREFGE